MKNLKLVALSLLTAGSLSACSSSGSVKPTLKTKADSISYALGLAQFPAELRSMLTQQFDGDSTAINAMIDGIKYGKSHTSAKEKAYATGVTMGQAISTDMIKQMNMNILQDENAKVFNADNIISAFITLAEGKETIMTQEEANAYLSENMPLLQDEFNSSKYGAYKTENEEFLTENGKKEGVITTESGLQYKVITEGKGASYKEGQEAVLNYEGRLIDGTIFDSSYERGEAATFDPNGVVAGFKEAIMAMPAGSTWEVYIPQELGYGAADMGKIKPYSTIIFKIELIEFK